MQKKTIFKVTAIVVCFAFITLAFPGQTSAKPRFDFDRYLKKPVMFFASLFSFLPIYDTGKYIEQYDTTDFSQVGNKVKVTGDLNRGRPSGGD